MGNPGCGRLRNGRTSSGNKDMLSFPAYAGKYGTFSGTEPDGALFFPSAGSVQEVCGEDFHCAQAPFSMKMMMSCVRYGETTMLSAAVYPLRRPVRKCSSSVPVPTWQSVCCTRSTAVWMRRPRRRSDRSIKPITSEYLDYDEVMHRYDVMMEWLADLYVNILNLIQYMHDKYYYEATQMALIDTKRTPYICNRNCRLLTCGRFPERDQVCQGKDDP